MAEYPLLCLGNPLLDIQVNGDQALLEKYGLKPDDAILAEEKHLPIYEEITTKYTPKYLAGGAAQNSARGAQYMLPPKSVVYLGCAGQDTFGEALTSVCLKEGVLTKYRIEKDQPTGRCGVIITGHHRSMVTDLAAANHYKLEHLELLELSSRNSSTPPRRWLTLNPTDLGPKTSSRSPRGTDPTIVVTGGPNLTIEVYPVRPVESMDIVDTNGAGDAFAGGFLAGLVQGKDLKTAVDMGQWLASWGIREPGPAYPAEKKVYGA
ncbi:unnamed protein product [Tuber melanosporum]|uniref:Adenosine kinase n=1 Tax=Tuber melanosporum (strain Mel28) TaxID=656061 RepID=D5GA95_TUBMM|nr:uncharacterized protein GSTUM_00005193001 [Tuber melanosporum]CAZ81449.1 unnamed protein product [Tuber melanosporum]